MNDILQWMGQWTIAIVFYSFCFIVLVLVHALWAEESRDRKEVMRNVSTSSLCRQSAMHPRHLGFLPIEDETKSTKFKDIPKPCSSLNSYLSNLGQPAFTDGVLQLRQFLFTNYIDNWYLPMYSALFETSHSPSFYPASRTRDEIALVLDTLLCQLLQRFQNALSGQGLSLLLRQSFLPALIDHVHIWRTCIEGHFTSTANDKYAARQPNTRKDHILAVQARYQQQCKKDFIFGMKMLSNSYFVSSIQQIPKHPFYNQEPENDVMDEEFDTRFIMDQYRASQQRIYWYKIWMRWLPLLFEGNNPTSPLLEIYVRTIFASCVFQPAVQSAVSRDVLNLTIIGILAPLNDRTLKQKPPSANQTIATPTSFEAFLQSIQQLNDPQQLKSLLSRLEHERHTAMPLSVSARDSERHLKRLGVAKRRVLVKLRQLGVDATSKEPSSSSPTTATISIPIVEEENEEESESETDLDEAEVDVEQEFAEEDNGFASSLSDSSEMESSAFQSQTDVQQFHSSNTPTSRLSALVQDLLLELFALHDAKQWLRKRAIVLVMQHFLGRRLERQCVLLVQSWQSDPAWWIRYLNDTLKTLVVTTAPANNAPSARQVRTRNRESARQLLSILLPALLGGFVGRVNAKRAAARIFACLQHTSLTAHVAYLGVDALFARLFHSDKL